MAGTDARTDMVVRWRTIYQRPVKGTTKFEAASGSVYMCLVVTTATIAVLCSPRGHFNMARLVIGRKYYRKGCRHNRRQKLTPTLRMDNQAEIAICGRALLYCLPHHLRRARRRQDSPQVGLAEEINGRTSAPIVLNPALRPLPPYAKCHGYPSRVVLQVNSTA